MSDQAIAYLEQLVTNEVSYKICSIILTILLIVAVIVFCFITRYQNKKTAKIREEWFSNLTEEQKKAIREQKNLKL